MSRKGTGRLTIRRTWARLLAIPPLIVALQPSFAATIEGVEFPEVYRAGDVEMKLNCTGLLRYMTIFKGYVAALYLGAGARPEDVLADVPKRLELSYFWAIEGKEFGPAGEKILANNIDAAKMAALRPSLDRINALYRDVKPGDRYSLTYLPGRGTELALNGEPLGLIAGSDFASAYFSIWLGPKPLDAALKAQLLSCTREFG
jgi:hypothetical protein